MSLRGRNYVFTYYPKQDFIDITESNYQELHIKYILYGEEICPTTHSLHLQGCVIFENAITFKGCKKKLKLLFDDTIHVETMISNFDKNEKYCKKDDKWYEFGCPPSGQGERSDISEIVSMTKQGTKITDIIDNVNINYQTLKFTENIIKYLDPPRPILKNLKVIWLWGSAGTGKTRFAYENFNDIYRPITEKWWNGYDGHKTILIDDFRVSFCGFSRLLQLTDIYPFQVETKGGSRQVKYDTIVITTPYNHYVTFQDEIKEDLLQLTRRITDEREITQRSIGNTELLTVEF